VFRVVRYLPVHADDVTMHAVVRAGVGQAPGEETAACAAVVVVALGLWRLQCHEAI
jgi:hypothetical protein